MALIVQKFGGSSVADAQRIFHVAEIITKTYQQGNSVCPWKRCISTKWEL